MALVTPAQAFGQTFGQTFGLGDLLAQSDYIHSFAVEAAKLLLQAGQQHGASSAIACGYVSPRFHNQRLGLAAQFETAPRDPTRVTAMRIRIGTSPQNGDSTRPQDVMTAEYHGSAKTPREMLEQLAHGDQTLVRSSMQFRLQHGTWEDQLKEAARMQPKPQPGSSLQPA